MNNDATNFDLQEQTNGREFIFWFLLTAVGFIIIQLLIQPFELPYQLYYQDMQFGVLFVLAGGILGLLQWFKLRQGIDGAGIWVMINALAFLMSFVLVTVFLRFTSQILIVVNTFPIEFLQLAIISLISMPVALCQFVYFHQKRIILPPAWLLHGLISAILISLVITILDLFFNQIIIPGSYGLFSVHQIIKFVFTGMAYALPAAFAISMVRLPGKKAVIHFRSEIIVNEKPFIKRLPKWVGIFAACTGIWIFTLLPVTMTISSRDSWILIIAVAIAALIRGTFQWLGFRRSFPNSKSWILITAGCEALGATILVLLGESGILDGIFRYGFPILISGFIISLLLGFPVGMGQWVYLGKRSITIHPVWMGYQFISLYLVILIFYLFENLSSYTTSGFVETLLIILGMIIIAAALLLLPALAFTWLKFQPKEK